MRRIFTALWLAAAACLSTAMAQACGTEGPACAVPLGEYRVALPAPGAIARPALVFLHGAGGAGADILGRGDIAPEFTRRQTELRPRPLPVRHTPAEPFADPSDAA